MAIALVTDRVGERRDDALRIWCDVKERASPLDGEPDSSWLIAVAMFTGTTAGGSQQEVGGTATLALESGRLLGIVSPNNAHEPALWWSWQVDSVSAEGVGSQGFFHKQPKVIRVGHADGLLELLGVHRLVRSGVAQPGQEGALLNAIQQGAA